MTETEKTSTAPVPDAPALNGPDAVPTATAASTATASAAAAPTHTTDIHKLAKSLLQLRSIVKAALAWETSTLQLEGHLEPRLARDAVRDARKASVRYHTDTQATSLMWPRIIKRDPDGRLRDVAAETDDTVYQVLEVLVDGGDEIRVSVTDSCTAVKSPLRMEFYQVVDGKPVGFDLIAILNQFYELVPTAVPGPHSIHG